LKKFSNCYKEVNKISNQIFNSNKLIKGNKSVSNFKKEIKCSICENNNFNVERIEPEIILLICENCGEIHKITPEIFSNKMLYLKFCISNTK
jgi:hypothetical protein